MENYICTTCGVQYPKSEAPPEQCIICEDDRQYVNWKGQSWTTLNQLRADHANQFKKAESNLYEIWTAPSFGISQRALLIQSPRGNILWDCISLIDEATVELVELLGGIKAIAISHPHYYSSMIEWSQAFNNVPVYIHQKDEKWITRPDPAVRLWDEEKLDFWDGIKLLHTGGHFPGSFILHWPAGANGKGAILSGDIIHVVMDRRMVSFMHSYPNCIPLPLKDIEHIKRVVSGLSFDRIYGAWNNRVVIKEGKKIFEKSVNRYISILKAENIE